MLGSMILGQWNAAMTEKERKIDYAVIYKDSDKTTTGFWELKYQTLKTQFLLNLLLHRSFSVIIVQVVLDSCWMGMGSFFSLSERRRSAWRYPREATPSLRTRLASMEPLWELTLCMSMTQAFSPWISLYDIKPIFKNIFFKWENDWPNQLQKKNQQARLWLQISLAERVKLLNGS